MILKKFAKWYVCILFDASVYPCTTLKKKKNNLGNIDTMTRY